MDDAEQENTKLDWKARSLLRTLGQLGGRASTTELREESMVGESQTIKRRMKNVLDPDNLVESEQPEPGPDSRVMPAKEFELTSMGETVADQLLDADEGTDPEEEFETQGEWLDFLQTSMEDNRDRIEVLERGGGSLPSDELRAMVRYLEAEINPRTDGDFEDYRRDGESEFHAMREYILNEVEHRTNADVADYREFESEDI